MFHQKNHFIGFGASGAITLDTYHKFLRIHLKCHLVLNLHMLISTLTKMDKDDSVLLYSHSGQTKDMIRIAGLAKEYNAKAIIFIGNPSSKLKAYSDARLLIESQEFLFNLKTLSSRILF